MKNQETLKRAKAMDIDFGDGQTLRGLLEDMEGAIAARDRVIDKCVKADFVRYPFDSLGCDHCHVEGNCGMTEQDCAERTKQTWIKQAESAIKKENDNENNK